MKILSFDIEEWFHILDYESTNSVTRWENFEIRIHSNVDRILSILDNHGHMATFFVVGWIAEKYPEIVKKISNMGYEIGSHSNMHQLAFQQSPEVFEKDVSRSINILEELTGKKIRYYRAPGFSITSSNIWSFEVLHKLGIEIDCSIFPAERAHGGIPSYNHSIPSFICYNGCKLKEFPLNTYNFLGKRIVFSGGGYFRIFPYFLIKKFSRNSSYVMTYFHPRDFDVNQPKIRDLSYLRSFKSYVGIKNAESKFRSWLTDFDFIDIGTADKLIDWGKAETINF